MTNQFHAEFKQYPEFNYVVKSKIMHIIYVIYMNINFFILLFDMFMRSLPFYYFMKDS